MAEKKQKILIIDDDEIITGVYEQKLSSRGYEVEVALDGIEGLGKTKRGKPDLVLLDIILPKLDGVMLFRKMRADIQTAGIPVILLTNVNEDEAIKECFKLGEIDYMNKSEVTASQVVRKIDEILSNQQDHN